MYTQEQKETAKRLLEDKQAIELIATIFLDTEDKLTAETINGKTNEELGEIVRAGLLAEEKIKQRYAVLKHIASQVGDKQGKSKTALKD